MTRDELHARLREEALAHSGRVSLAALLGSLVPVDRLRELAREHGLSPKGGYRLEKAPVRALASLLAAPEHPELLSEVCGILAERMTAELAAGDPAPAPAEPAPSRDLQPILKLREQELKQARGDLHKARDVTQGLRDRLAEANREATSAREQLTRRDKTVAGLRDELERLQRGQPVVHRDQSRRIQTLEKELDEQAHVDHQQRMRLAEQATGLRERDDRIAELEALVPQGKRRRRRPPPPEPERFVVPHFTPSFLKSLVAKDRRSIEQAYRAVFLFCTEGSRYPGLQVKLLEGTGLWSLRASLRLRVYFRRRPDGDVDILELLDREEQETMLRRYKERQE